MKEQTPQTIMLSIVGALILLVLALGYSILYYLKFTFFIDPEREEFVLQKGVLSSETISLPFDKIQRVNFKRNLLQRIIGVYSILIDTAGSKEEEVEIKALSKAKAEELSEILMNHTKTEDKVDQKISQDNKEEAALNWQYSLNISQLLKLGISSNYIRGLLLLMTFYLTLKDQLFLEQFFPSEMDVVRNNDFGITPWTILLLLLAVVIVTVADTFIKYFKLNLIKTDLGLQVEMGLRKNKKVSLKGKRVQSMEILSNPIQKRLDLNKVKILLATSADDPGKSVITIPGISQTIVSRIKQYVYNDQIRQIFQIVPNRMFLFRKIIRGLFPLVPIPFIIEYYDLNFRLEWIIMGITGYLILLGGYQFLFFRSLKLSISKEIIVKYSGVWRRKKQYLEMWKLQSVSISQPLWHEKQGLANLIFHSAGGDIFFEVIDKNQAEILMDYLLFKIESTSGEWM
ncbi:PH domain-containing protein [Zunongwangia sp. F363]|uniref:PH domain-containing protein n=1 Tax=Autumnicola tepida TaxID=3075595 RepID=A0ABU3C8I5_9FLAO|nr:PH domain-containing protein [Zunongwangia sp. F363]MDT0642522.1 PH domain-containing protein [Zunongwangia sp. F363]